MNPQAAADAIEAFLRALGHEPTGELANTGKLVAEAWCNDLLAGYAQDAAAVLRAASFAIDEAPQLIVIRDIAVTTMCPHHLLPAHGRGDLVYMPTKTVAGLGALARALGARARRLTLQEQVGSEMAQLLTDVLGAKGALCRLRLTHTCLVSRGAREASALVETIALSGTFSSDPDRGAALAALGSRG